MPNLSGRSIGEKLLRPIEVQTLLGIAASTLWAYSNAGLLRPAQRTAGGHAHYRESDVVAFKAALTEAAA
jgi:DNA-binding transcriptional MerR regulator